MRPLKPRLAMVAAEVERLAGALPSGTPGGALTVVDVGCDHGGLALTLLDRARAGSGTAAFRIVATDRNRAPCARARLNAERLGLPLDVRQGDGLDPVDGPVDIGVICGVGSETAVGILGRAGGRVRSAVVQPNDEGSTVRRWAAREGYCVGRERAVREAGRYYPVLVLTRGPYDPDEVEIAWGARVQVDREVLHARLVQDIDRFARIGFPTVNLEWAVAALGR